MSIMSSNDGGNTGGFFDANLWNLTLAIALFAADSLRAGFRAERVTVAAMDE